MVTFSEEAEAFGAGDGDATADATADSLTSGDVFFDCFAFSGLIGACDSNNFSSSLNLAARDFFFFGDARRERLAGGPLLTDLSVCG